MPFEEALPRMTEDEHAAKDQVQGRLIKLSGMDRETGRRMI